MTKQERSRAANKRWREKNPERNKEHYRRWYAANRERQIEKCKQRDTRARVEVLQAYGGACVCCGENNWRFLALDHVDNDGAAQRRAVGWKAGTSLYYRLKGMGYPRFIQLLCHNCNVAKGLYGFCPHGNSWRSMTVSV